MSYAMQTGHGVREEHCLVSPLPCPMGCEVQGMWLQLMFSSMSWATAEGTWLLQPGAEEAEGRPEGSLQFPHERKHRGSTNDSGRTQRNGWSCVRAGLGWISRKGSSPRGC